MGLIVRLTVRFIARFNKLMSALPLHDLMRLVLNSHGKKRPDY